MPCDAVHLAVATLDPVQTDAGGATLPATPFQVHGEMQRAILASRSRRLSNPIAAVQAELWIVTHADLRQTARIRAFLALAGDGLASQRERIEGRILP